MDRENFGTTFMKLVEKFAGKESNFKLTFHDLTVEAGTLKSKLDGFVVLNLVIVNEKQPGSDRKLASLLGQVFKEGEIAVSLNDRETLQLKAKNKEYSLDLIDKQFVKKVRSSLGDGKASLWSGVAQAKKLAEELRDED